MIYMGYPLVGGVPTPLKNDGLRQLGLNMENIPNHQPVSILIIFDY